MDASLPQRLDREHEDATRPERIRDMAMRCFAQRGIATTSLRTIAAAAGVSIGLIQHYFGTKKQLIECIDEHVLAVFNGALNASPPLTEVAAASNDAGDRFAELMCNNPDVMDYVGRALAEGGEVGKVIFDGLRAISEQQGVTFAARGMIAEDLDPTWAPLLPLILRVGTIMLRPHLERHLTGPLYDSAQTTRWDAAVTRMIREGQLKKQ